MRYMDTLIMMADRQSQHAAGGCMHVIFIAVWVSILGAAHLCPIIKPLYGQFYTLKGLQN